MGLTRFRGFRFLGFGILGFQGLGLRVSPIKKGENLPAASPHLTMAKIENTLTYWSIVDEGKTLQACPCGVRCEVPAELQSAALEVHNGMIFFGRHTWKSG